MGNQAAKDIKNGSTWLDMRQDRAIWLIIKVRKVGIRLNKARKTHDNGITTLHKGVLGKKASKKIKSMRLLCKVMVILYKGLPHPKGKNVSMGTKCKIGAN